MPTLYIDDSTGMYYTWDGSKFVRYNSNKNVQMGDKGDQNFQDQEEKERQATIDQETKKKPKMVKVNLLIQLRQELVE